MHKAKHAEHHHGNLADNREMPAEHRDTYEQWRDLLVAEEILKIDGSIDVEKLEQKYPNTLDQQQIVWIEAMQKGEVVEDEEVKSEPEPEPEKDEEVAEEAVEETEEEFSIDDKFSIQIEEDGEPEEVTVVKITKDGIHLASSLDENTEYLVDPEELKEMIVD